jgi:hypothetical protein
VSVKPKPGQQGASQKTKKRKVKVKVPELSVVRRPRADFDVSNLKLQGQDLSARLSQAISDGSIDTTIQGASTLALTVSDWYRGLLNSQLLYGLVTLNFDGLNYTLVKVSSSSDAKMTLTFEETAVNILRRYSAPKKADRANTTRAQFVRSLVQEPKEARIPFKCPEVNVKQPIAGATGANAPKPGQPGSNVGGWITTGATWFSDCPGAYGDLCDGGLYYAELGEAGANAYMGGLLGKALGGTGPLVPATKLQIQFHGKTVTATKKDVGSGQAGDKTYTIDLHETTAKALGFISAGKGNVRLRKVS